MAALGRAKPKERDAGPKPAATAKLNQCDVALLDRRGRSPLLLHPVTGDIPAVSAMVFSVSTDAFSNRRFGSHAADLVKALVARIHNVIKTLHRLGIKGR